MCFVRVSCASVRVPYGFCTGTFGCGLVPCESIRSYMSMDALASIRFQVVQYLYTLCMGFVWVSCGCVRVPYGFRTGSVWVLYGQFWVLPAMLWPLASIPFEVV